MTTMTKHTKSDLYQMQGMSLDNKVKMTKRRIQEWVDEYGLDGVYVSFSGGKDSTVLLTMAREMYPDMKAVFVDTGLEYPEIRQFVKTWENVDWLKPKKNFKQVINDYGYPFISKEVSECVYGARKYLTSIIQEASLDRQTGGIAIASRELLELAHIRSIREGKHHLYSYETERILGIFRPRVCQNFVKGGVR